MRKNFKKLISLFLVLSLMVGISSFSMFFARGEDLADSKRVLLIQDRKPWDSDANTKVLNAINANYSVTTTSKFTSAMLEDYGVVILANDQTTDTYDSYVAFSSELEKFVKNGGTVVYGACDGGWANGYLSSALPGGVLKNQLNDNNNYIQDKTHPIVTGVLTDSKTLTDRDLYSNYCSHIYFIESTLPVGSNVIFRSSDNGQPTLVEYPMGEGMVIASGLTWEHNYVKHTGSDGYGTFALKAMDDYFSYAIQYYNSTIVFDVNNVGINEEGLKYNDTYFGTTSYIYNHELAKASMGLATAAMISDNTYKNPDAAKKLFNDLKFCCYEPYNYENVPTTNSIACVIAGKNNDETKTSIIAIGIRGGGYEAEWGGNFNVGTGVTHAGFDLARQQVFQYLNNFLRDHDNEIKYKDNVKFWVSGYSRAAATSNLVGSALDNGKCVSYASKLSDYNFSERDVFVYTFETPRNTKDSDAKNSRYDNIFNIINREDPVPRVAPAAWKYVRYGKDCYLPSTENSNSNYYKLLPEMKKYYKQIAGKDYSSFEPQSFDFKEIDIKHLRLKSNSGISKGVYLDGLMKILSKALKSADNYNSKYQSTFVNLFTLTKGNTDLIAKKFGDAWNNYIEKVDIDSVITEIREDGIAAFAKKAVTDILYDTLKDSDIEYDQIKDMVDVALGDILAELIKHPNYAVTTFQNAATLMNAHYTQVTAAWLYAIDGDYKNAGSSLSKILTNKESYRVATINCPVDVNVYDDNGDLRGSIVSGEVINVSDEALSVYIDDDGQMCVCLPNDGNYTLEITGNDFGTLNCSFADYDFELCEKITCQNYYDIPVEPGKVITANISEKGDGSIIDEVVLYDENNNDIIPSESIENDDIKQYEVIVSQDCENAVVYGGGVYSNGEFAQVTAISQNDIEFIGWYNSDGDLLSNEAAYRFRVISDVKLTARFDVKEHSHEYTTVSVVPPTCTENGLSEGVKCSICGYVQKEQQVIPSTGHSFNNWTVTVPATLNTEGLEERKCMNCGYTESRSIDKLTSNYVLPGDVDGDGNVSVRDARSVLRLAAKLDSADAYTLWVADADGDGKLKVSDARLTLRIAARLESATPYIKYPDNGDRYEIGNLLTVSYDEFTKKFNETCSENEDYYFETSDGSVVFGFDKAWTINDIHIVENDKYSIYGLYCGMSGDEVQSKCEKAGYEPLETDIINKAAWSVNDHVYFNLTFANGKLIAINLSSSGIADNDISYTIGDHITWVDEDINELEYQVIDGENVYSCGDTYYICNNSFLIKGITLYLGSNYSYWSIYCGMSKAKAEEILSRSHFERYSLEEMWYYNKDYDEYMFIGIDKNGIVDKMHIVSGRDVYYYLEWLLGSNIEWALEDIMDLMYDSNDENHYFNSCIDIYTDENDDIISIGLKDNADFRIFDIAPKMTTTKVGEILGEHGFDYTPDANEILIVFFNDTTAVTLTFENGILEYILIDYDDSGDKPPVIDPDPPVVDPDPPVVDPDPPVVDPNLPIDDSWKNAAIAFIENLPNYSNSYTSGKSLSFELIDMDNDGIPEILPYIEPTNGYYMCFNEIWTFNGEEYVKVEGEVYGDTYIVPITGDDGKTVLISSDYYSASEYNNYSGYFNYNNNFRFFSCVKAYSLDEKVFSETDYYINEPVVGYTDLLNSIMYNFFIIPTLRTKTTDALNNAVDFANKNPISEKFRYFIAEKVYTANNGGFGFFPQDVQYRMAVTHDIAAGIVQSYIDSVSSDPVQ